MTEEEYFKCLLGKTNEAFKKAPIKLKQIELDSEWNFSICETPIQKNTGIIVGLNWGAEKKRKYSIQKEYPKPDKEERSWPFISTSKKYFEKHLNLKSINEVNYSNLCFFRSPDTSFLTPKDWELAIPLFKDYVRFINPPWILLLGNTGIDFLRNDLQTLEPITIKGAKKKVTGYRAVLFDDYQLRCLPHPNSYRFRPPNDIEEIWSAVIK